MLFQPGRQVRQGQQLDQLGRLDGDGAGQQELGQGLNRDGGRRLFEQFQFIAGLHGARLDNPEINAGAVEAGKTAGHAAIIEADVELVARLPGLHGPQAGRTDTKHVANAHLGFE